MSGRPAYDRGTYRADLKTLRRRGKSIAQAADELGMSRATAYRILGDS